MRLNLSELSRGHSCVLSQSSLFEHIKSHQYDDPHLLVLKDMVQCGGAKKVKYEHQRPGGLLQKIDIPEWKWERITIDFVVDLPQTLMIFDVEFSIAFHPQTNGKYEQTIQILEDMLRAYVMDFGCQWDQFLPLTEFAYNNSYHPSIQMARIRHYMRGDIERLRTAPFRKKSYDDSKAHDVAFIKGEKKHYEDPLHVLDFSLVHLDKDLTYVEEPVAILDRQCENPREIVPGTIHVLRYAILDDLARILLILACTLVMLVPGCIPSVMLRKAVDGEKSLKLLCDEREDELAHLWYELQKKTEDLEHLWIEVVQAKCERDELKARVDKPR
ncbi:uncharacterized protein [Nicotiana sylvestris]|uniref:uncharacterized protein n=1 Tax=Nicotiana sylvestris TaxID=4096 RepID=UPI00388C3541